MIAVNFNLLVLVFATALVLLTFLDPTVGTNIFIALKKILFYQLVHTIMQVYRGSRSGSQVHHCKQYDNKIFQKLRQR